MSLTAYLEKSRTELASRWADAAGAVYPFATVGFLRTSKEPFTNPVGQRSDNLAALLFSAVIGQKHDGQALAGALEEFVRVRAIQDMTADKSLAVLFAYTAIFREFCKERTRALDLEEFEELARMEARQAKIALAAFAMYAKARETLFAAQLEDTRRRHSQILRLARRHGLDTDTV